MYRLINVTLSTSPDAPAIRLPFTGQFWNGHPIVLATSDNVRAHLAALAANDPNGTWDEVQILDDEDGEGFIVRFDDDADTDTFHATDTDGVAATTLDWNEV